LLLLFAIFLPTLSVAQTTLTVAAAADLASLEPELSHAFRDTYPQIALRFVSEASGALTQQIENGAPYDVFLSANAQFVDRLAKEGKLRPESVLAYAEGRLGMLWRDRKPHETSELRENWVHFIALANPKLAPYGLAAQQALEHAGIWKSVQRKVVYGENVRQALQLFESGNADAVITANSLLKGKGAQLIPENWHQPILQKAGIVASTKNREAAASFLTFLVSPAGKRVFTSFGFGTRRE
jgi:molybdate transport system substrate-binding protein